MYIKVKVIAGARKETLEQVKENEFKISVKEKAENNMANKRICQVIEKHFHYPGGGVRIISGHHSPVKLLKVGNQ